MARMEIFDISLKDTEGNEFALRQLWHEGPGVIVWLRHYG
jgi:hypothetical protein